MQLETVKLALLNGYQLRPLGGVRHFYFEPPDESMPEVSVSWYQGSDSESVTVGDTTTSYDRHGIELLKPAFAAAQETK